MNNAELYRYLTVLPYLSYLCTMLCRNDAHVHRIGYLR
jgi:hypothetical protein